MKGNAQVLTALNQRLSEELAAINQYIVHSEMALNWGYEKYGAYVKARALAEMKHAEALIERILFLEGTPAIVLASVNIGADIQTGLLNDHAAELDAIEKYNASIALATQVKDDVTRALFEANLQGENDHLNQIEAFLDQIEQMGIENFLSTQT